MSVFFYRNKGSDLFFKIPKPCITSFSKNRNNENINYYSSRGDFC